MESPLVEGVSSLPPQVPARALWMVMLTVFMDTFANNVLIPMLAPYAKNNFNATDEQVGLLFSCPSASAFLFSYVLPKLTNRLGRKPVFVMSLLGMSVAALCQGTACNFNMLLLGRTFGGFWIVITSTARVYVNEVTEWDATGNERGYWFAQMSLWQNVAKLFAPGVGGALTHYGLNAPSLVTAVVELVGSALVCWNVVESPKFLKSKRSATQEGVGSAVERAQTARSHLLLVCSASMFTTACMKLTQTVFALFAIQAYGLDTIDIGFIYLLGALATIVSTRIVVPLNRRIGAHNSAIAASIVHALSILALPMFPLMTSAAPSLRVYGLGGVVLSFSIAAASSTLSNTFQSIITGELPDQPTVQSRCFQFRQGGQILVPIIASHLLNVNATWPWIFGALLAGAAAVPCYLLKPQIPSLERQPSGYGAEWKDDVLTKQEIVELGEFMAELLRQKHLRWSTHKEQVGRLLQRSVPEMPIHSREDYYEALVQFSTV